MKLNLPKYARVAALAIPLGVGMNAMNPASSKAGCVACSGWGPGASLCLPTAIGYTGCVYTGGLVSCYPSGQACPLPPS